MRLILLHFLVLNLTAGFNVTLFKSYILNWSNYIRWAYQLATFPSSNCLHHNQAGGQNIYFAWQPTEMTEYLARAAVQAFYQEKKFYDYSHPNFNHDASHFTNMIWKSTNRIGIAVYIKKFYNQHGGCHIQAGPLRPLTGHMVAIHEWPRGNTMTAQEFNKNVLPAMHVVELKEYI